MLLDFIKPHQLPHESLIKKDTAYVLQDVDTQTAVIYFSTKDADPELYRTTSIADIYSVINELGLNAAEEFIKTYPTRTDYAAVTLTQNSIVHIESDVDNDNDASTYLFVAANSSLIKLGESTTQGATVWHSTEW